MTTYTCAQLGALRDLARAYGHWYADFIDPLAHAGYSGPDLREELVRLAAAAEPEGLPPCPVTVAGPPAPDGRHRTGTGRLQWAVSGNGAVTLTVWSPHPDVVAAQQACRGGWEPGEAWRLADEARRAAEAEHPDGVLRIAAVLDIEGRVTITEAGTHAVRHVDALVEALRALSARVPTSLYAEAVDLRDEATALRELGDVELVLRMRGL